MKLTYAFFEHVPRGREKVLVLLGLSISGALLQGMSVGLLLPALQIIERPGAVASAGRLWSLLSTGFGWLGLQMTLLTLLSGVLCLIICGQGLIYLERCAANKLVERFIASLREKAFHTFLRADLRFHYSIRAGVLVNGIMQDLQRTGGAFESLLEMMTHVVLLCIYSFLLFLMSWQTALTATGIVIVALLVIQSQVLVAKRIGRQMMATNRDLNGFVMERTEAIRLVKLGGVDTDTTKFSTLAQAVAAFKYQHATRGARLRFLMEPTLAAGGIIAIYIGQVFFHMSLAELSVFLYVLIRIVPEAYSLSRSRFNVAGFGSHFDNIMQLMQRAREYTTVRSGPLPFRGLSQSIQLEDVTYAYDRHVPVLVHVHAQFIARQLTAIVGPSGVGKSTLLDLLVRLVDPTHGRVLIDGIDIREFDAATLHRYIALVTQDVLLFNDTVLGNIQYGCLEATEAEGIAAAKAANAHGFIERLPQGYATLLGPRGMTLSGGERQRIALARALVRQPAVLLLDEVTSGLDAESERLIQESVFQAAHERTVIVTTHRLSTIRHADKVLVLAKGGIAEEGTPEQLIAAGGLFRRYHDLQMNVGEHQ